jgi:hypothetical protein
MSGAAQWNGGCQGSLIDCSKERVCFVISCLVVSDRVASDRVDVSLLWGTLKWFHFYLCIYGTITPINLPHAAEYRCTRCGYLTLKPKSHRFVKFYHWPAGQWLARIPMWIWGRSRASQTVRIQCLGTQQADTDTCRWNCFCVSTLRLSPGVRMYWTDKDTVLHMTFVDYRPHIHQRDNPAQQHRGVRDGQHH